MSTSSARPESMTSYTSGLQDPTDTVVRRVGTLDDAIATLRGALPAGYYISSTAIPSGHVSRVRRLDEWVAEVGARFRAADSTGERVTVSDSALGDPLQPPYVGLRRETLIDDFLDTDPSPAEVDLWWSGLTAGQRDEILESHYEQLADLEGLYLGARYMANRYKIEAEIERAEAEVEELQQEIDDRSNWNRFTDWVGDGNPWAESGTERLEWLQQRLDTLRDIAEPHRQILRFDPAGDGRVVEVFGNLTTADNVATVVPGMTNDIANYSGVAGNARRLREQMDIAAPGDDNVTIAWLGYDTPDDIPGAAAEGAADDGGPVLVAHLEAVAGYNPDCRHVVVAHSYGSVVAGRAMGTDLDIDAVAVVGSPGMGPDDRDDLGSPDVTLYAGDHEWDAVPFAPAHGEDPSAKGYGAERFVTDVHGHSAYFDEGSLSLENLARISVGLEPIER